MTRRAVHLAALGLGLGLVVALVGRGGLLQIVGSVLVAGLGLGVSVGLGLAGLLKWSRLVRASAVVASLCLLQLVSIPIGSALNRCVARARAWC